MDRVYVDVVMWDVAAKRQSSRYIDGRACGLLLWYEGGRSSRVRDAGRHTTCRTMNHPFTPVWEVRVSETYDCTPLYFSGG